MFYFFYPFPKNTNILIGTCQNGNGFSQILTWFVVFPAFTFYRRQYGEIGLKYQTGIWAGYKRNIIFIRRLRPTRADCERWRLVNVRSMSRQTDRMNCFTTSVQGCRSLKLFITLLQEQPEFIEIYSSFCTCSPCCTFTLVKSSCNEKRTHCTHRVRERFCDVITHCCHFISQWKS